MMRALIVCALMAQPVAAECFVGQPHKVTYTGGQEVIILGREGERMITQSRYADGTEVVRTSHLGLFPLEWRAGGKIGREKLKGRLPRLADLVPGFRYDLSGTSESLSGEKATVRYEGSVSPKETVMIGNCAYETTVISESFYLNGEWLSHTDTYLRTDMLVVLKNETYFSGASATPFVATAIE